MQNFLDIRWKFIYRLVCQQLLVNKLFNAITVLPVLLLTLATYLLFEAPSDEGIFLMGLFGLLLLTMVDIIQIYSRYYFYQLLPVTIEETVIAQWLYRVIFPAVAFLLLSIIPTMLFEIAGEHWAKSMALFFCFRLSSSSIFSLLSTIKNFYRAHQPALAYSIEILVYLFFVACCFFIYDIINEKIVLISLISILIGFILWFIAYFLLKRHMQKPLFAEKLND